MQWGHLRIAIADDESSYFTPQMLGMADKAGFAGIERYERVTSALMDKWLLDTPDIVILDIKGVTAPEVAKDGFGVAMLLRRSTNAYVVVTSAHQFHLRNAQREFDYVIEDRLLTAVDFVHELEQIADDYFKRKARFYRRTAFRLGRLLIKSGSLPGN